MSKDRLDVAVLGEKQEKQVGNTQAGIQELVAWLLELQPELIVVEATGGYQRTVVDYKRKRKGWMNRSAG